MLKNYFKIASRNLKRQKGYTFVNVAGLAVGLSVCLLVLLFLRTQWRLDRFHAQADRIYRVTTRYHGRLYAPTAEPLAPALRKGYAGVETATRLVQSYMLFLQGKERHKVEGFFTDPSFFRVFDGFRLKRGNRQRALAEPRSVVLTQETARRLFPGENPVGQTLMQDGETAYTVTGVLAEPKGFSHLKFEALFSYASLGDADKVTLGEWTDIYNDITYLLLEEGADPATIEAQIAALFARRVPTEKAKQYAFQVESLDRIRFGPSYANAVSRHTNMPGWVFYFLGVLALIVLAAAGFNYVNLTVARSLQRRKEIGVRKTLGALRGQIARQFLFEAVLVALIATFFACLLLQALIPLFNQLYIFFDLLKMPPLAFHPFGEPRLMLLIFGFGIFGFGAAVGLLAGAYPALVLSSFRPVRIFKPMGRVSKHFRSLSLRKTLITAQLAFTLVLIITTATMYRQVEHMATADYGLRTERLISVDLEDVPYEDFRRAALRLPGVESVAATNNLPLGPSNISTFGMRTSPEDTAVETRYFTADTNFVRQMGVALTAALPGWRQRFSRGEALLLNETAAEALGFESSQAALGQTVVLEDELDPYGTFTVAGVVEDYYFEGAGEIYGSMGGERAIPPMVLHYRPEWFLHALVRAEPGAQGSVARRLEGAWQRFDTIFPFDYRFYSDVMRMMYGPLADASYLIAAVALLAVLIACLGLLSLAAQNVETRTKEIGIRKALGAEVGDVVRLLSKGFVVLVAAAALLAVPLAWLLNKWWLQFFAYRVELGAAVFAASIGALLVLVLTVVGSQTIKAALANPADSLRYE